MSATETECPFPETADVHTSSEEYAQRFAGPAGRWMLDVQERLALGMVGGFPEATIVDVGGGHGQLALPLCRAGRAVTVVGSDDSCAGRIRAEVDAGRCGFVVGNVVALPFEDQAFDVALCFRLLTHCERWPALVAELCRVASKAVVVDYPTSQSLNAVAPALFGAKKKFEKNTRTWTLFRHSQVADEFAKNGFVPAAIRKQFFLPMVLHRMLKSRGLSASSEAVCRALGLTCLWGSPVVALMVRR
jgi:ubiquinone/menaquinone biosynthesis C-methylase UbiE